MSVKQFFTILRDLFMPQRRNACPHCGGVHCIGACQFNDAKVGAEAEQYGAKQEVAKQGTPLRLRARRHSVWHFCPKKRPLRVAAAFLRRKFVVYQRRGAGRRSSA